MKPDFALGLDNAAWPAFMVDDSGTVRHANAAAVQTFGTVLEGEPALSSSIWSAESEWTPQQFLTNSDRSPTPVTPLKFRAKGGVTTQFDTCVCSLVRSGEKFYLFQLFRGRAAPAGGPVPVRDFQEATPRKIESGDKALSTEGFWVEISSAQKQKLDCALQLARTVALDFNNALTTILGHASWVLSKMEPNHPWRNSLSEVEKAAQRAAEIADDLAAFSRQDKDPRAQVAGNLNDLVRRAVEVFQRPGLPNILWTMQLEKELFSVRVDEAKMQQAFIRILENAVEAVGRDGGIAVRTRNQSFEAPVMSAAIQLPAGSYVYVEIADNGCGIPQAVLPRVFEPFFSTKNSPEHRGLGLAWVYGIVTNHDGKVSVSSLPGQGTTVRIFLPAQKKIVKDPGARIEDLRGGETILMVDNDEMVLSLAETILSTAGYKVWVAGSGHRALDLFSQAPSRIDLIITDLVMPGMSGREFIDHIRRLSPTMPILSISGYVRPSSDEPDDEFYLRKPYTAQELLRKVKRVLSQAGAS